MRRSTPIPSLLKNSAFLTSDTALHEMNRGRLRGPDIDAPFRGVRSIGLDLGDFVGRCRAYEPLLRPGQVFCGPTAALLLGLPLPLWLEHDTLIHVGTLDGSQPPRRNGVHGHRLAGASAVFSTLESFLVTDAASTWCTLAKILTREDLVAAGDCILSGMRLRSGRSTPHSTLAELETAVLAHGTRHGAPALRWALPLLRTEVDSRPESLLRLLLRAAGYPEPRIAHPVPVSGGAVILHPDLAWVARRIALEYEGDEHRLSTQRFRSDIRRRELFEAANWRVIRVTADDLGHERAGFLTRVRDIYDAR